MHKLLDQLLEREVLNASSCEHFIHDIHEDKLSAETIAACLISIEARGAQLEEIQGFRRALIDLSIKPNLSFEYAIDLCGTGGDSKGTINISTCTSFVLAALGYKVIKHGNYGVSSLCGSSNVLEELGVKLKASDEELQRSLDKHNICFFARTELPSRTEKSCSYSRQLGNSDNLQWTWTFSQPSTAKLSINRDLFFGARALIPTHFTQ